MRLIPSAALLAAVAACGDDTPSTQPRQQSASQVEVRYTVERLPSLGGTQSRGMAINERGWVAGWSNQPTAPVSAVVWQNGIATPSRWADPSSTVPWPGLNDAG